MAQTHYIITERFMPGSPRQREERLGALLAEYRRMLEQRVLQEQEPGGGEEDDAEQAACMPACPAEGPGAAPPAGGENNA